jgi:hypothetical protein
MEPVFFPMLWAAVAVYLLVAVLLIKRSKSEVLAKRSPILVLVSHIGNCCEVLLLLIARVFMDNSNELLVKAFQAGSLFFHSLYYLPYLLRCYRLHLVFRLDRAWTEQSDSFYTNRHRASQSWLVKVLVVLMLPALALAVLLVVFDSFSDIFPTTCRPESNLGSLKLFYIALSFIEELVFVVAVWACRDINDDFAMSTELTIVCGLWFSNSFIVYWITEVSTWILTAAARNCAIMCVSSLWPLLQSYRRSEFGVPLTLEVLNSLELLLQNEGTLEAFSKFLSSGKVYRPCTELDLTLHSSYDREGVYLLDFWLNCEVYKHNPTTQKAETILDEFIKSEHIQLTSPMLHSLESSTLEEKFLEAQEYAFKLLQDLFFPLFQRSPHYNLLLKEVNRQDIYLYRLTHTSFLMPASSD